MTLGEFGSQCVLVRVAVTKPPEMIELAKQDAQKSPQKAAGMTMAERLARRAFKIIVDLAIKSCYGEFVHAGYRGIATHCRQSGRDHGQSRRPEPMRAF
jgi:hypothetical protein